MRQVLLNPGKHSSKGFTIRVWLAIPEIAAVITQLAGSQGKRSRGRRVRKARWEAASTGQRRVPSTREAHRERSAILRTSAFKAVVLSVRRQVFVEDWLWEETQWGSNFGCLVWYFELSPFLEFFSKNRICLLSNYFESAYSMSRETRNISVGDKWICSPPTWTAFYLLTALK